MKIDVLNRLKNFFYGAMIGGICGFLEGLIFKIIFYKGFPPQNSFSCNMLVVPGMIFSTILSGIFFGGIIGLFLVKIRRPWREFIISVLTLILLWIIMVFFGFLNYLTSIWSRALG